MLQSTALSNDEPALVDAPMVRAAQKLLAFLIERETIGLTQGKAFQRRFVHWAAAEFAWPGWEEDKLFSVNKVLNEYDFPPLEALHFVLLKLKLIRHEKLTCRLTKSGRAMAGSPGDLFNEIAPFYLFQVDHAAWSRLSESRLDDWSLCLNLLHVEAAHSVTCGALREALYGPPHPAGSYDRVPGMIWNQVLRPLCWVGLLADITTSEHAILKTGDTSRRRSGRRPLSTRPQVPSSRSSQLTVSGGIILLSAEPCGDDFVAEWPGRSVRQAGCDQKVGCKVSRDRDWGDASNLDSRQEKWRRKSSYRYPYKTPYILKILAH